MIQSGATGSEISNRRLGEESRVGMGPLQSLGVTLGVSFSEPKP